MFAWLQSNSVILLLCALLSILLFFITKIRRIGRSSCRR